MGAVALVAAFLVAGCSAADQDDPGVQGVSVSESGSPAVTPQHERTTSSPDASDAETSDQSVDADSQDDADDKTAPAPQKLGPTEQPTLPVVDGQIDEDIELDTGIVVSLSSVSVTQVEAETPGDVAGDAVVVIVEVTNKAAEVHSLDSAVITLETSDGEYGISTIAGDASPLGGELAPNESAEGRYLFMLDPVHDRNITINVNYSAGEPIAQFTGQTPGK